VLENKLPPMAGGSDGHYDHSGPHDRREYDVICIEAKRVCDFCFQEHRLERQTTTTVTGTGVMATCMINEAGITCREVERRKIDDGKKSPKELVCVAIEVPVTVTVTGPNGAVQTITDRIVFLKQAVLCAPSGTDVECQVTGDCCCFADGQTGIVNCVFDFCVVIQTKITVRVLVPTLGECPPKRCRSTVLGCPPQVPEECKRCTSDD